MTHSHKEILPICNDGTRRCRALSFLGAVFATQEAPDPALILQIPSNELRNRFGDYPNLKTARAKLRTLQKREIKKIYFYRQFRKMSESANADLEQDARHLASRGLLDDHTRGSSAGAATFNAAYQVARYLEAVIKMEAQR